MSFANNLSAIARLLTAAASGVNKGITPPTKDSSAALATTEWFKTEQAAEANQGTARVATQAQTNAGADDTTIVTPKKLRAGLSLSLGMQGYIAFPSWVGGLIIQWGSYTTSQTGDVGVTYPIAFPSGATALVIGNNSQSALGGVGTSYSSRTGFNAGGWVTGGRTPIACSYIATGF